MTRTYEATPRWGFRGLHPHAAVGGTGSAPGAEPESSLQVNPERLSLALLAEEQRQVLSLLGRLRRSAQTPAAQPPAAQTPAAQSTVMGNQPLQRRAG